jgi:hypothetical protein
MDGHCPGAAAAILAQLALMAFVSYILITQPSSAWLLSIAVAFAIIVCIGVLGEIVGGRRRRPAGRRVASGFRPTLEECRGSACLTS